MGILEKKCQDRKNRLYSKEKENARCRNDRASEECEETQEKAKQKDSKPNSVQSQPSGSWWAEGKQKPHLTSWTGDLSEEILAVLPMGQVHDAPRPQIPIACRAETATFQMRTQRSSPSSGG